MMIIVQSIPPITYDHDMATDSVSKEKIDEYNADLKEIAIRLGIYFLDINAAFATSDGYLSSDYAAPDGVHFSYTGYQKWYDYLITHTVQGSSIYSLNDFGYLSINE